MADRNSLLRGFRLSEWIVRPEDGSLTSPIGTHRLEPLLMDLLVFLCSRAKQVVSKQELLDRVWGGRFVSNETVKGSFYQLRKVLGDDSRQPRFIETLPKRGYRILLEPELLDAEPENESAELCRKGRAALSGQVNATSLQQARLYFERATQSDPENAEALAGLARVYVLTVSYGLGRGAEFWPRAKVAASRAEQLNPKLAEAHLVLGVVRLVSEHAFVSAENEFRLAIQLQPADALAHGWYARFLSSQNRHDEALAEARHAVESDPLSLAARRELLEVLLTARRYEETVAEAQRLFDIVPSSPEIQLGLVWVHMLQCKEQPAFEAFQAGIKSLGIAGAMLEQVQAAFDRGGMQAILRLWAQLLEQQTAIGLKTYIDQLVIHALLGEADRCFELLELLYQDGHPYLLSLPVSPLFDSLRGDPRYPGLLAKLGHSSPPFPNP